MKKKLRVNDEELVKALIYCKHRDGELCHMCSFGRFASHCSSIHTAGHGSSTDKGTCARGGTRE